METPKSRYQPSKPGSGEAAKLRRLPDEEAIRQRAHEIWLSRGGGSGHEMDDWLEAERELRSGKKSPLQRA